MTKQESIFEVAKTFYAFDKKACYEQLKKINFDELRLVFGENSDLETDIRNLTVYVAVVGDVPDLKNIDLVKEYQRILNSQNTKMFYNKESLVSTLLNITNKKLLTNSSQFSKYNLPKGSRFLPDIDVRFNYSKNSDSVELIKDDIVKLINLNKVNLLSKDRLSSYKPLKSEEIPLLSLKILFSIKKSLFDFGLKSCNELLEKKGVKKFDEVNSFINYFLTSRGLNDDKLSKLINKFRLIVQNTADELELDKSIFMYEYELALSGSAKIDLLKKLKLLITKYTDLNIDTSKLLELSKLKGM